MAIIYYRNHGMFFLLKRIALFTYRGLFSLCIYPLIDRYFERMIIDSIELRRNSVWIYDLTESTSEEDSEEIPDSDYPSYLKGHQHSGLCNMEAFSSNEQIVFENRPRYLSKDPFVTEIEDIVVLGPRAAAMTQDGLFIADTHDFDPYDIAFEGNRLNPAVKQAIVRHPIRTVGSRLGRYYTRPRTTVPRGAILYQAHGNYYHWIEHLLKIQGIQAYEDSTKKEVTLIISENAPDFVRESLQFFGFGADRLYEWDGDPMHVQSLVVPSFPEFTHPHLSWLRDSASARVDSKLKKDRGWIFVSRQKSGKRYIENYNEFKTILDRYGIEPVFCEDMSFKQQVELFQTAGGVIGVTGAGLTNIIWSRNIDVIIIQNNVVSLLFDELSRLLGHRPKTFLGRAVGQADKEINRNIIIDIPEFEMLLKETMNLK